ALVVAFVAVAALAGSHEEYTAEEQAAMEAKIATLSPQGQEAAKKIIAFFKDSEGNMKAAIEQTKAFTATLPEAVLAEIKAIVPAHHQGDLARAKRQATTAAPAPAPATEQARARRQIDATATHAPEHHARARRQAAPAADAAATPAPAPLEQ
ncbi:hypothetical protein PFISCL1PPCAC_25370, partial [Pristionchus fissidentatus]